MIAPPRSRCRSPVPEAIPTRVTGTDAVSECDAGVPAIPTPAPMNAYDTMTADNGVFVVHNANMKTNPSVQRAKPMRSVQREPSRAMRLLENGAATTIAMTHGRIAKPASNVL